MKKIIKQKKLVLTVLIILVLVISVLYTGTKINKEKESIIVSGTNAQYTTTLSKNNCKIVVDNNTAIIQKYNGNADTLIIDKDMIQKEKVQIYSKAFLECGNLEKILIDKEIMKDYLEIENFQINMIHQ